MSLTNVRDMPLAALELSKTPAQVERRAHLDKGKLSELAASIKAHGLVQPILVRPIAGNGHFEVVAGERRVLAARQAGLEVISATVRELSDEQVYELQLVENLQRQDLHELAEAEGYEALARLGHTVDDMAAKVGKSKATVYARMKLLALDPASRQAMYRGELSASVALLIARIPVASVQREACGAVTKPKYGDDPLSYREARDLIERDFMLRLADAPFPTNDADLLPKAGTCAACPKRTGNQPELFGDVKGADVCTDPVCFKLKREAWAKAQIATAKADGQKVITGAEAKKLMPGGHLSGSSGFVRLDDSCYEDADYRKYSALLGRKPEGVVLLQAPSGDLVEIISKKSALSQAKASGKLKQRKSSSTTTRKAESAGSKLELAFRDRLLAEINRKAPRELPKTLLAKLADYEVGSLGDVPAWLMKAYGLKSTYPKRAEFERLTTVQLHQFLYTVMLLGDCNTSGSGPTPPDLLAAAKELKIDAKELRKAVANEAAPAKATKSAKKK